MILLDANLPENNEKMRKITDQLYRSDHVSWRILQRSLLGIGGMKALGKLNYAIDTYHLNEGHAAFALIERYVQLQDKAQFSVEVKNSSITIITQLRIDITGFK